jgi:hypothetical protein
MATTERTRSTSDAWQAGQMGGASPGKISSSNGMEHWRQTYS